MQGLYKIGVVLGLVITLVACDDNKEATQQETQQAQQTQQTQETAATVGKKHTEPVELEFWTTELQSDRVKTFELIFDLFEAETGHKVKVIAMDENDVMARMVAAVASKNMPDLALLESSYAVALGQENLVNTNAVTSVFKEIGVDNFYTGSKNLFIAGEDQWYATPYTGWVQGIWYRSDWFEQAGLNPPVTWEDILEAARHFYEPENKQYGILVGTMPEIFTEQVFTQFALSNDAYIFDKDGDFVFNSPEMLEALEYYVELAQYTPPGPQTWRARDYYLQGKVAMMFYSTFIMDDLALYEHAANSLGSSNFADLAGADFDPDLVHKTNMASSIRNRMDSTYGTLMGYTIFNKTEEPKIKAAQELIKFMYEEDVYITWTHVAAGGYNPAVRAIAMSEKYLNDPEKVFEPYGTEKILEILDGLENLRTFSVVDGQFFPIAEEITAKKIIPQMIYRTVFEDVEPWEALIWAEKEMLAIINN